MEKTRSAASANPGLPAIGILRRGFRMNFPEAAALFTSSRALLVFIGSSERLLLDVRLFTGLTLLRVELGRESSRLKTTNRIPNASQKSLRLRKSFKAGGHSVRFF